MPEEVTSQTELLRYSEYVQQLAPFFLLSLLLHVALIFVVFESIRNPSITQLNSMEVRLPVASVSRQASRVPDKTPAGKHRNTARPDATASPDYPEVFNSRQLMESAKNMARDEARTTEQRMAAQEQKRLNAPVVLLEHYLKQPHKEIRLANGMLKIITDFGAICFQPAPYFARESAGVFNIPTTCP